MEKLQKTQKNLKKYFTSPMDDNQEEVDDLYGDLEDHGKDTEIESLKQQLEDSGKKLMDANKEIDQLREQIVLLVKEKQVLENNMVKVYNTALTEIKRKDREIMELRKSNAPRS